MTGVKEKENADIQIDQANMTMPDAVEYIHLIEVDLYMCTCMYVYVLCACACKSSVYAFVRLH